VNKTTAQQTEQPIAELKGNIHTILSGNSIEKEKLKGHYFHIHDTPEFMKKIGLTGEYFSIRYGIISRHRKKDDDHNLSEENWIDLCNRIIDPFVITRKRNAYKLFIDVKVNNRNIVVCVNVKKVGKILNVNAVKTVYGYRERFISGEVIYKSKKITPEQTALLDEPNALSLPSVRGDRR